MKIYIITDLEGAALVSSFGQTRGKGETPELKQQAMQLLTGEVNAAVDGILDVSPQAEVIVWDGHGSGGIDIMTFHPEAKLISRGPIEPPYYLDPTFDALFFVGQHAMAGTENACLCHTYSSKKIDYYKLNGQFVGEFGARAMMAGMLGVPTVFISGDDKAVAEARELIPRIHAATVKQSLGLKLALHLSARASRQLIRKVAGEAVRNMESITPLVTEPPFVQEIRVKEGVGIENYLEAGAEKIDDRTVLFRSHDLSRLHV